MFVYYLVHILLVIYGILDIIRTDSSAINGMVAVSPGYIVIIAAILSILRFSIGRILIRLLALYGILNFVMSIFNGYFTMFYIVDLLLWGYIYLSFGKTSWWYHLYKPLGILNKLDV